MLFAFYPATHWLWIGKLLAIVVLGGLGSLKGTFVAAMILGLAEQVATVAISLDWAPARLLRVPVRRAHRAAARPLRHPGPREPLTAMKLQTVAPLVALALFFVLPVVVREGFYLDLLLFTFMYAAMSVGWDIMGGSPGTSRLATSASSASGRTPPGSWSSHFGIPVFVSAPFVGHPRGGRRGRPRLDLAAGSRAPRS